MIIVTHRAPVAGAPLHGRSAWLPPHRIVTAGTDTFMFDQQLSN